MTDSNSDRRSFGMKMGPRAHEYEVNAMLRVSSECEQQITDVVVEQLGVKRSRIQSDLHLTVYHGRRRLPGLRDMSLPVDIVIDTAETRFMVLAPGGENPRFELDPGSLSVGIRVTKRNPAVADIQRLRENVYQFETAAVIGSRKRTTAWTNCFGSRHYQPHIRLLKPWSKIQRDLTELGQVFRSEIEKLHMDVFCIESRNRIGGGWVAER